MQERLLDYNWIVSLGRIANDAKRAMLKLGMIPF